MAHVARDRGGQPVTALLILIPLSLGMGMVGLGAFFWAMRHDQFDDPDGNAWRVLNPSDTPKTKGTHNGHLAPHPENRNPARRL